MYKLDGRDLGFVYVSESNADCNEISNLDIKSINNLFFAVYDQCLQSFDVMNRNNRMYDGNNIWSCITESEKIQSALAHNCWYMEFDHPLAIYKDQPLSPERIQTPYRPDACAIITKPRMVGNKLYATIKTTSNSHGTDLAKDMVTIDLKPMASLRAIANMTVRNGKPYVIARKVITYDRVDYGSHREADQITPAKIIVKKPNVTMESTSNDNYEDVSVIIPLTEILRDIGEKDVNNQVVLESFGLDTDDIIGLDSTNTRTIIKNDGDMMYINMDPTTVKRVNDYLSSF